MAETAGIHRIEAWANVGFSALAAAVAAGAALTWLREPQGIVLLAVAISAVAGVLANPISIVRRQRSSELLLDSALWCTMAILTNTKVAVLATLLGAPIGLAILQRRSLGRPAGPRELLWIPRLVGRFVLVAFVAAQVGELFDRTTFEDAVVAALVVTAVSMGGLLLPALVVTAIFEGLGPGAALRSLRPSLLAIPVGPATAILMWVVVRSGHLAAAVPAAVLAVMALRLGRHHLDTSVERERLELLFRASRQLSTATSDDEVVTAVRDALCGLEAVSLEVQRESGRAPEVRLVETGPPDALSDPEYVATITGLANGALERLAATAQLSHRASHDVLTGLANRSLVLAHLREAHSAAARHGRRLGVVYVDLDHFKLINDTFDHDAGDEVLVAAAERLRELVRAEDLVGRLGGEEFVIVVDDGDTGALAHRVVAAFRHPIAHLRELPVTVTASVGWTELREHDDPWQLVHEADLAAKRAKETGRNRVVASSALTTPG
jgi:diguanylate cyclase (GGDEF)-like protein